MPVVTSTILLTNWKFFLRRNYVRGIELDLKLSISLSSSLSDKKKVHESRIGQGDEELFLDSTKVRCNGKGGWRCGT